MSGGARSSRLSTGRCLWAVPLRRSSTSPCAPSLLIVPDSGCTRRSDMCRPSGEAALARAVRLASALPRTHGRYGRSQPPPRYVPRSSRWECQCLQLPIGGCSMARMVGQEASPRCCSVGPWTLAPQLWQNSPFSFSAEIIVDSYAEWRQHGVFSHGHCWPRAVSLLCPVPAWPSSFRC